MILCSHCHSIPPAGEQTPLPSGMVDPDLPPPLPPRARGHARTISEVSSSSSQNTREHLVYSLRQYSRPPPLCVSMHSEKEWVWNDPQRTPTCISYFIFHFSSTTATPAPLRTQESRGALSSKCLCIVAHVPGRISPLLAVYFYMKQAGRNNLGTMY